MHIVLLGESQSGKTTIANYLTKNFSYKKITPVDRLKRHLEEINNLPPFSLDTQEGKNKRPMYYGRTYGQILVNMFHFWEQNDILYSSKCLMKDAIKHHITSNSPIVFDSIRTCWEIQVIKNLSEDLGQVKYFLIQREGSVEKTSDQELYKNLNMVDYQVINNDRPMNEVIKDILL